MRNIYLIFRRDYLGYVKAWGFWLSLAAVPIDLIEGLALPCICRVFRLIRAGEMAHHQHRLQSPQRCQLLLSHIGRKPQPVHARIKVQGARPLRRIRPQLHMRFTRQYGCQVGIAIGRHLSAHRAVQHEDRSSRPRRTGE